MKRQINTETPFAKILKIWRSLGLKSLKERQIDINLINKRVFQLIGELSNSIAELSIQLKSARIELDTSPIEL